MATQSLFDIIYSSTSTPLKAQEERMKLQVESLQAQNYAFQLGQERQFASEMQNILGPGNTAADVIGGDDPKSKTKFNQIMAVYAQYHPDKLPTLLNAYTNEQQRKEAIETKHRQNVGALFGAVNDAEGYKAIAPEILAMGGYKALGLTGNWEIDSARVKTLGRAGMSAGQQATDAYRWANEERMAMADAERARHNQEIEDLRNRAEKSIEDQRKALQDHWTKVGERIQAAGEARLGQQKELGIARARQQVLRYNEKDIADTAALIADDPRLKGLSKAALKPLARTVLQMARTEVASSIKELGDVPDADTYSTAIEHALNKLSEDGKLVKSTDTFLGFDVKSKTEFRPGGHPTPAQSKAVAPANLTPQQDAYVSEVMKLNPGYSRETIIQELKKRGKL